MKKIASIFALSILLAFVFTAQRAPAQKKTKKIKASAAKPNWNGMWSVPSRFTPSTLTVNPAKAASFRFDLNATNGANAGLLSGTATVKGKQAFWDDRTEAKEKTEKVGCRLTFTHKGEYIDIEQTIECEYYAGNAVVFAGEYRKDVMTVKEDSFVYLKVFPSKTFDDDFRRLVERDYEKFLDSFHLISEEENQEDFGAKVFSACVRGVCPFNAAIIMFDETGSFWAAVIYPDYGQEVTINYYSNVPAWTDKMPKTIEKWVKEKESLNKNVTVNFKSK